MLLYFAGSAVNRVQVVLSEFGVNLFCFVQVRTVCRYGFLGYNRACVCRCEKRPPYGTPVGIDVVKMFEL